MKTALFALTLLLAPSLAMAAEKNHGMMAHQPGANAATTASMNAMKKMHQDMAKPMSGDADRDFAMMMVPHHEGAIEMAKIELKYGNDPEMRRLAKKIIAAQDIEIQQMKKWQGSPHKNQK